VRGRGSPCEEEEERVTVTLWTKARYRECHQKGPEVRGGWEGRDPTRQSHYEKGGEGYRRTIMPQGVEISIVRDVGEVVGDYLLL